MKDSIVSQVLKLKLRPTRKLVLLAYVLAGEEAFLTHSAVAKFVRVTLRSAVSHAHCLEALGYLVPTGKARGLVKAYKVQLP